MTLHRYRRWPDLARSRIRGNRGRIASSGYAVAAAEVGGGPGGCLAFHSRPSSKGVKVAFEVFTSAEEFIRGCSAPSVGVRRIRSPAKASDTGVILGRSTGSVRASPTVLWAVLPKQCDEKNHRR